MRTHSVVSRFCKTLVVGGFAFLLPPTGFAFDNVPPETLNVKVFPDRYVAGGKPFADLASLEAWARPILLREVWVDSCGPAAAAQTLAAVERLQSAYKGAIRVRTLASGEAACVSAGEYARLSYDLRPEDRAYLATDESGRSVLP